MEKFLVAAMKGMREISCVALAFIIAITMTDIIARAIYKPITGTYELVSFAGAITIGCALPIVAWEKSHVFMEFFIDRMSEGTKKLVTAITRAMVTGLFFFVGVALYTVGAEMKSAGEVALTLKTPVYPIVYAISVVCFFLCIVYIFEIVAIVRKKS